MMTPEREAAIRAWPRSSYRDRVDVRDLLAELDKERARAERAEAALREARSVCDAVLACETYHDERGHAYLKVPARSIYDPAAQVSYLREILAALAGSEPAPEENQQ